VYAYLRALAAGEEEAELGRLAYVACTRAKRRLALVAVLEPDEDGAAWKPPGRASILGLLRPPPDTLPAVGERAGTPEAPTTAPALARLPLSWRPPPSRTPLVRPLATRAVDASPPFDWARERARRLGVVVHLLLAQVASEGLERWDDARLIAQAPRIEAALVGEGALPAEAGAEATDVRATLAAVLRDPRGRWLFEPSHDDARSEWALTGVDAGDTVHVVLDRTFVAEGVRWIVDFKTGSHEGADATGFLDAEVERYRSQLERYQRIVAALDPARPISLALYHPRVDSGWREVS